MLVHQHVGLHVLSFQSRAQMIVSIARRMVISGAEVRPAQKVEIEEGPVRVVVSAKRFIAVSLSECEESHTLSGQRILASMDRKPILFFLQVTAMIFCEYKS